MKKFDHYPLSLIITTIFFICVTGPLGIIIGPIIYFVFFCMIIGTMEDIKKDSGSSRESSYDCCQTEPSVKTQDTVADIAIGAIVQELSGGPKMTVEDNVGGITCTWFSYDGEVCSGYFSEDDLEILFDAPSTLDDSESWDDNLTSRHRITHCWNCKKPLDNESYSECDSCGWITCPSCGACGCNYR